MLEHVKAAVDRLIADKGENGLVKNIFRRLERRTECYR